jgi:uncharacterized protein (DUF1697 family)
MTQQRQRYVALLRAINVGGHAVVSMAKLRQAFESFGATSVSTYIQSGNVLFDSRERNRERLTRHLEQHLSDVLGRPTSLILATGAELAEAAARNPFPEARRDPQVRCHLLFLAATPDAARCRALMALKVEDARFAVQDRILYYSYRLTPAARRRTIPFERLLGVQGTARTFKVVDKLIELCGPAPDPDEAGRQRIGKARGQETRAKERARRLKPS